MQDNFLTVDEVVEYLKIPKSTIYKLTQNQELPFCKIGKQLRFKKESLDKWLSEKESSLKSYKVSSQKSKLVLVIDDDKLVLRSLARFLKSHGYELELAQNAEEALEKVKKMYFDLIITDIRMPEINGIETIKKIREINRKNKRLAVPELVITGYSDSKAERELEQLKITDCLYKPFATADFLSTVEKALS
jgi:excisionase family DNA binding protein